MNLITRIKNLWALSAYAPTVPDARTHPILTKTVTTMAKKAATIVDLSAKDPFDDTAQ